MNHDYEESTIWINGISKCGVIIHFSMGVFIELFSAKCMISVFLDWKMKYENGFQIKAAFCFLMMSQLKVFFFDAIFKTVTRFISFFHVKRERERESG